MKTDADELEPGPFYYGKNTTNPEKFLLFMHEVPNCMVVTLGVLPHLFGIYRVGVKCYYINTVAGNTA